MADAVARATLASAQPRRGALPPAQRGVRFNFSLLVSCLEAADSGVANGSAIAHGQ